MAKTVQKKTVWRARTEARRRHLLDVARALFAAKGFHQTGIALIASESGIAVGQIYRDFNTKGDIIAAICEADVTAWLEEEALAVAVDSGDLEAIRRWLRRFAENRESDGDGMLSEILSEAARNPEVAAVCRAMDVRIRNSLSTALGAIMTGGANDNALAFRVELILTIGFGVRIRRILRPDLCDSMFRQAIGYIFDGELNRIDDM